MTPIHEILKKYWGYAEFRPLQEDIINTVLEGKDCLALLPTGGGKSLCFQVPALAQAGLCLVISPLIALMKDQVENLRKKNITAFSIHSGLTRREVINTLILAGNSNCKFLYVSPERLETNLFKEYLLSLGICLIAVDEAHCISQWGYDFRPSYLRIAALREELPGIPVLALTASATPEVQQDICTKLQFTSKEIFRQSFLRPNLSYSAFNVPVAINKISEVISNVPGTGIVYCRSRKKTKEISDLLNMQGIVADYYHAGLPQEQRNNKQDGWLKNKIRIIVCTNAFGMGIDKPDVRVVIHTSPPDCLENYYQEAGRAGRDGKKSYAVLLYNDKEIKELKDSTALRFPGIETIRKVYGALMNHLQIASGTGEGNSYDIDLNTFITQFQLKTSETVSVLKTLEQEGMLSFNEQVFIPAKLQIIATKETLRGVEKNLSHVDALVKNLLRSYEGIIDQPVNIFEKAIAGSMKIELITLASQLRELQAHGIVEYVPQKEKPQVYFLQSRVRAEDLRVNMEYYNRRKQLFSERIGTMVNFVYGGSADGVKQVCRSIFIGNYFGDEHIQECGICDVCLEKKRAAVSVKEFELIAEKIFSLANEPIGVNELIKSLNGTNKEKAWEVIRFLQAENKISVGDDGLIVRG
ncbi:MAG: ATP-dependent DNA helicase RecQ [Flavitalea sp.]